MGLGILAGLALSGPAVQAADYLKATISTQPIYVDGQRVDMTAYSIGGNNYVRLRDIGRAVDFGVTYNAATNSVHIDSTQPYQEEIPPDPLYPTEARYKMNYLFGNIGSMETLRVKGPPTPSCPAGSRWCGSTRTRPSPTNSGWCGS